MACTFPTFVDDTKFVGAVTTLEDRNTVQRDLNMLEKGAKKTLIKFA